MGISVAMFVASLCATRAAPPPTEGMRCLPEPPVSSSVNRLPGRRGQATNSIPRRPLSSKRRHSFLPQTPSPPSRLEVRDHPRARGTLPFRTGAARGCPRLPAAARRAGQGSRRCRGRRRGLHRSCTGSGPQEGGETGGARPVGRRQQGGQVSLVVDMDESKVSLGRGRFWERAKLAGLARRVTRGMCPEMVGDGAK